MDYFLCVIGLVMFIEGLPYAAFPDKMKMMMERLMDTPDGALRRIGLVLMSAGLLIVWLGRRG